jgi:hypothetical protein
MASYTDAISQFNPYVQQLPVELMAKVGMQKQAQYDAGVQKIQNHIDNVAGLDIAHDADKQYLQSKLGQLGNRLKTVAAGDFSNQQLVNSVSGMTGQIIKDPTIQNAVASTAWYKKQKDELDKAYKDGKSSIANVDDFNTQAQKWLSSPEAGQVFKGRYSPYVDVEKHNLEIFKALHASETGKDFIMERYTDPITGKLLSTDKLAVAMEREGVEGISAKKIETALRASYTPDILNQMRINANFEFKGVTPEQLQERATKQYASAVQRTDEEIERLEGIAAMSGAQPVLQKRAMDSIKELQEGKVKLSENYKQQVENIFANPDRAKFEIYKEGTIDQFANGFSWEKRTTQVLANPQYQGQMEADRLALQKAGHYLAVRGQNWQEYMDNRKQTFEENKDARDNAPADPFMTVLGEVTKGLPAPLTSIAQSTVAASDNIEKNIGILLKAYPELKGNRAELQKRLIDFQNGDKTQFSVDMRETAQYIIDDRKKVRENQYLEEFARKEVETDPNIIIRRKALEKDLSSRPGISLNINGQAKYISAKDVYDFARKLSFVETSRGGGVAGGSSRAQGSFDVDPATLNTQQKYLYDKFRSGDASVISKVNSFGDLISQNAKYDRDVDNRMNGLLAKRIGKFAPTLENLDTPKPAVRSALEGIVGSVLLRYDSGIAGMTAGGDVFMSPADRDKAKGWMAGEGKADVQYKTVRMGDDRYIMMMKGAESVLVKMTAKEASHPTLQSGIDTYGQEILEKQTAFHGSTNPTGKIEDAQYGVNFFTNINKYRVVADLKSNPQNPAANYITLQVKLSNGWQPIQLDASVDASRARAFLSTLTDADIEKALRSKGISIK